MNEIKLEQIDQSIQVNLPLGYKFECMFTTNDLSYTVQTRFVDMKSVIPGIQTSYSESNTLIKYSKAAHSPVSAEPTNCIRLATPSYYRNLKMETNSELIADDLEGAYIEEINLRNQGSAAMETMKMQLNNLLPGLINHLSVKTKWICKDCWMYCIAVASNISQKRKIQMKYLSPDYDFMTKIKSASKFAKQLGRDVGKHISVHKNLKCDHPGFHVITSTMKKEILEKQGGLIGEHLIFVDHGPVIYLNEDKIEEYMNNIPKGEGGNIIPFVKRKKYENQQEYRFVISVQWHSPNKDILDLQVSEDLRNLMSPIEDSVY